MVDGSWERFYFVTDYKGSVVALLDDTGVPRQEYRYDSWGNMTDTLSGGSEDDLQPFRYNGALWDADTGLYHFGARDYDPVTSRWIQKEPLGLMGSMNFYSYCSNDPINYWDLNGLNPVQWPFYRNGSGNVDVRPTFYNIDSHTLDEVVFIATDMILCKAIKTQKEHALRISIFRYGDSYYYKISDLRVGPDKMNVTMPNNHSDFNDPHYIEDAAYTHTHIYCGNWQEKNLTLDPEVFSKGDMSATHAGKSWKWGDWYREGYVGTLNGSFKNWNPVSNLFKEGKDRSGRDVRGKDGKKMKFDLSKCKCEAKKYNCCP